MKFSKNKVRGGKGDPYFPKTGQVLDWTSHFFGDDEQEDPPADLAAKIPEGQAYDALKMIVEVQAATNSHHLDAKFKVKERKDNQAQTRFYVAIASLGVVGLVLCGFVWKAFQWA